MISDVSSFSARAFGISAVALLVLILGCPPADEGGTPDGGAGPAGGDGGEVSSIFPVLPGASTIIDLAATDAIVGGQGRLRVTLGDLVSTDTTVTLTSSDPAVAAIPASVTILTGSDQAEVSFDALAVGSTDFTAQLASSTRTTTANVVSSVEIFLDTPFAIQTGARSNISIFLGIVAPSDLVVNLSSSNPDVFNVPTTVVVPSFTTEREVSVTAGTPGSAFITATLGSSSRTELVNVVTTPRINSLSVFPSSLLVGANAELQISLDAVVAADTAVTLTSSNPAVAAVPATATVPAGRSFVDLPGLTGLAAGNTAITATLNDSGDIQEITVVSTLLIQNINLPSSLERGEIGSLRISLNAEAVADTVVTLSSSDPAILQVPASITILAGEDNATTTVNAVGAGLAVVTATLDASVQKTSTLVVEPSTTPPVLSSVGGPSPLRVGEFGTVFVSLTRAAPADIPVTFENDNPAVLSIPASAVIPAGEESIQVPVDGLAVGVARVRVSALGDSFTVAIEVQPALTPAITSVTASNPRVGLSTGLRIQLNTSVATDTTITLTNSAPAVLQVPASAVVVSGDSSVTVPITGLAASPPNATITATLGASTGTATITVLP